MMDNIAGMLPRGSETNERNAMARKIAISTAWEAEDMAGLFETESSLVFARRIPLDQASGVCLTQREAKPHDAKETDKKKPTD